MEAWLAKVKAKEAENAKVKEKETVNNLGGKKSKWVLEVDYNMLGTHL